MRGLGFAGAMLYLVLTAPIGREAKGTEKSNVRAVRRNQESENGKQ